MWDWGKLCSTGGNYGELGKLFMVEEDYIMMKNVYVVC